MDLASLITPGPDPLPKARASYNPVAPITGKRCAEDSYFSTTYSRSPQPPLSPPVDDQPTKCSLPSISYLLNDAEAHEAKRQRLSPPRRESDPRTHYDAISAHGPHVNLPPTPPLRPESGFHSTVHSPSASSVSAVKPDSYPSASSVSAVKPDSYPPVPVTLHSPTDRSSISSQGSTIHHHHHHHSAAYASPAPSVASYSSPVETTFYPQQRPGSSSTTAAFHHSSAPVPAAPAAAATTPAAATLPSSQQMISPVTPAWQHHHYFPPSTSAPYQQNHDRYICRTCHKAFSRPSSLRIHSHSHTGEKPFRCTHVGCGKAFSVRSNMKRHERGCHSGRPVAAAMV